MNCPYCNSPIEGPAKFCPNCGGSLMQQSNDPAAAPPSPAYTSQGSNAGYAQSQNTFRNETMQGQQFQQTQMNAPRRKSSRKKRKKKKRLLSIVMGAAGVLLLLGILSSIVSEPGNRETAESEARASAETQAEQSTQNEENLQDGQDAQETAKNDDEKGEGSATEARETWKGPDAIDYSIPRSALESGGYAYVTLADLDRYIVNMTGQNVYTVVQADKVEEDCIKADIGEGFTYQIFETVYDYRDYFKEGDLLGIFGTVGETTDGPFNMDWTHILNCQVFAYGENARAYQKETTDESMAGFLTLTEAVANSRGKNNISEDEFKSLCQYYPYEDILRNPDSYKNRYAVLAGTVDQTIEGAFGLYTSVFITDGNGDKWACTIVYKEGQSRILQGDYVTVFGILDGTSTSTTLLGKQVSMPSIDIQYVE